VAQKLWPTISVRVPKDVYAQITLQAQRRDLPASIIVREVLARAFGQEAR
jgi:hypothetical protein